MTGRYLDEAVRLGLVQVARDGDEWVFTGASQDMLVAADLEEMGAEWVQRREAWVIDDATEEQARVLGRMERRSKAVAAAVAARGIRARRDGAKTYDRLREALLRRSTRRIQDVYRQAILEHQEMLRQVMADMTLPGLKPEEVIELRFRRGELEELLEILAEGLTKAGASAEALTRGMLPEAQSVAWDVAAWQVDCIAGVQVSRMVGHNFAALATYRTYNKPKWTEAEIAPSTKLRKGYDAKAWEHLADKAAAKKLLKQAIARGLLTGEHPRAIAKRIEGTFDQWERRAEVIARTETCRIMSEATQEYMRAANDEGVKLRNRWDAKLDGKTRKSHRKVDGEVVEVGKRFGNGLRRPGDGGPEESINCRCCLTPVLDGFAPDAPMRLDGTTGKLIPYCTYEQWVERYKPEGV